MPGVDEVASLLRKGLAAVPAERPWAHPGCVLKTRGWPEVRAALENLFATSGTVRSELSGR